MRVDMAILPPRRLSYFRMTGILFTRDSEQAFLDYVNHPLFDPRYTFLTNSAPLTGVEATFLEIVAAVFRLRKVFDLFDTPVLSVLYCETDVAYGMARVLQQVAEPTTQFEFFVTCDPAEALAKAGQPETGLAQIEALLWPD